MSEAIYVLNVSELELHNLVEKSGKGLGPLLPNEIGKVSPEVVQEPRVQRWLESKRLKVVSEEEFYKHFNVDNLAKDNAVLKTKHRPESVDGTTVIIPGLDELPEVDEIPEPIIHNIDKTVSIRAPEGNEPLVERVGDPIEVNKKKLKAIQIDDYGFPFDKDEPPKATPLPDNTISVVEETSEVESATESQVTSANDFMVSEIVNESAWRRQVKAIDACDNKAVIEAVQKQTKRDVIKRACAERLKQL